MYYIYVIELLTLIYLLPAVSLFPKLILSSRTAITIPFVSILIIVLLKETLSFFNLFSQNIVLIFHSLFFLIASYRLYQIKKDYDWPKVHILVYLISFSVSVFYAARLGISSFGTDDEIYSWNMWAVQHFLGENVDYYYTTSAYPQFFSILIAYCYKILGTVELQLPVRSLLAFFPFSLLVTIGIASNKTEIKSIALFFFWMLVIVFGIGIGKYFDDGLADPMMSAALIVSVFMFIQYINNHDKTIYLFLSSICAIVAAYSKQPALIWAILALPLITSISVIRRTIPLISLLPVGIVMLVSIYWVLGPGFDFQNNQGVINASQHDRDILEQVLYSFNMYLIKQPMLFILFILSTISVFRSKKYIDIYLLLLLPSTLAWFIFGAYSGVRLGIHVIALLTVLYASTGYYLPFSILNDKFTSIGQYINKNAYSVIGFFLILAILSSSIHVYKKFKKNGDSFDIYNGSKVTISKYFGKDSEYIFNEIYGNKEIKIWIPSNYIYGIFYGHNSIIRPDKDQYSLKELLADIKNKKPDYLFYSGDRVAFGQGSKRLHELVNNHCSDIFQKVAGPENKFGYIVYKLKKESLHKCPLF